MNFIFNSVCDEWCVSTEVDWKKSARTHTCELIYSPTINTYKTIHSRQIRKVDKKICTWAQKQFREVGNPSSFLFFWHYSWIVFESLTRNVHITISCFHHSLLFHPIQFNPSHSLAPYFHCVNDSSLLFCLRVFRFTFIFVIVEKWKIK